MRARALFSWGYGQQITKAPSANQRRDQRLRAFGRASSVAGRSSQARIAASLKSSAGAWLGGCAASSRPEAARPAFGAARQFGAEIRAVAIASTNAGRVQARSPDARTARATSRPAGSGSRKFEIDVRGQAPPTSTRCGPTIERSPQHALP